MKPNLTDNLREINLETDTTDGNRATRFRASGNGPPWPKPNLHLGVENGRLSWRNQYTSVNWKKPATGKEENFPREVEIDTTL